MTTASVTTVDHTAGPSGTIDPDRLCVAARSVLDQLPDLVAEGLTEAGADALTGHAGTLADLPGLHALPVPDVRAHALAVHRALTDLAGDRSLTLAVWFGDGLGAR